MAWRAPSAGEFRDRITIQRRTATSDGMGGMIGTWANHLTNLPARVNDVRGGEEIRADRLSGITNLEIVIRANAATRQIVSGDRIVNGTQTANIKWIGSLDAQRRFLVILAEMGGLQDG